nr:hypothetical protein [Tanacetum cinerariifolium]
MYSFDMMNIVPQKDLICLLAKAINGESMLWHRRLGHINFKNVNKLVKDNLVRGLPSKRFENDQTCVACLNGKQHKVSFKFTQVFFLATKDETSRILKCFIAEIEKLVEKKVKIIICDNGTEFKNRVMNEFCEEKDSKLPTTFWAKVVNTACYVQTWVLVVKPHFMTPYELFKGRSAALSFKRPFRCHVTILNTLDQLGKFDEKSNEGIFVGYSTISKAFRVYNIRTRKDAGIFNDAYDDIDEGAEDDYNNLETVFLVSPIPFTRIHKHHPKEQIIGETKIHVNNESAICMVKNHVYHSKTKHIEIRHHFIRDSYEKRLIEMVKIHTDYNVADLLTKAFDVTRFQFLTASIGLSEGFSKNAIKLSDVVYTRIGMNSSKLLKGFLDKP